MSKEINCWADIVEEGKYYQKKPIKVKAVELKEEVVIFTREGSLKGYKGDFLIEGIEGELYPCGRDIFFKTYGEVKSSKRKTQEIWRDINVLLGLNWDNYEEHIHDTHTQKGLLKLEEAIKKLKVSGEKEGGKA